jgi:hypothetical protein
MQFFEELVVKNLEETFISAVLIATHNDEYIVYGKVLELYKVLEGNFKHFEIIIVDNLYTGNVADILKDMSLPLTIISLSKWHNTQQALSAGIEMAIGDYIVEIPDIRIDYSPEVVVEMYKICQQGNDFVFLTPIRIHSNSTKIFYKMLNKQFKNKKMAKFNTSIITLSSRRGQNKIADIGQRIVNRNIMYALTGLKSVSIPSQIHYKNRRILLENIYLLIDSLICYTNYILQFAINISLVFFIFAIIGIIYGFISYFVKSTVNGWASIWIMITSSFCIIFFILFIICKYLSSLLNRDTKDFIFVSVIKKEKGWQ